MDKLQRLLLIVLFLSTLSVHATFEGRLSNSEESLVKISLGTDAAGNLVVYFLLENRDEYPEKLYLTDRSPGTGSMDAFELLEAVKSVAEGKVLVRDNSSWEIENNQLSLLVFQVNPENIEVERPPDFVMAAFGEPRVIDAFVLESDSNQEGLTLSKTYGIKIDELFSLQEIQTIDFESLEVNFLLADESLGEEYLPGQKSYSIRFNSKSCRTALSKITKK